jgi:hypothetical protein
MDRACEICGIEYWEINPLKKIRFVCDQECKIRWIVRDEMEKIMFSHVGENVPNSKVPEYSLY